MRDLGYAAWYDPDAWLETMSGPRWQAVLRDENNRINSFSKNLVIKDEYHHNTSPNFICGPLRIAPAESMNMKWDWFGDIHYSKDVFANKKGVWFIHDVGHGAEVYQIDYKPYGQKKTSWSIKPVGQKVAVKGSRCYYLGVMKKLWYNELWSCDAETGEDKILIYKELNPEIVLDIVMGIDKIYMTQENSQDLTWWLIEDYKITRASAPEKTWANLKIEYEHGAIILKKGSKKLIEIPAGKILIDPWAVYENRNNANIIIQQPHQENYWLSYSKLTNKLTVLENPSRSDLQFIEGRSSNGTRFIVVMKENLQKPKRLLITGYGAYGLMTATQYARIHWNPLIESEWAIAYTFLPGGGDHDEAYAKQARRDGRIKTIDSFLDCVKTIKSLFHIASENIVIYGRSAGGLLIGGSLTKYPDGSLFGGIFTEVPYLDELRTTTNTSLPLTQLEYKEFGDPAHNLQDFLSVGLLSPADAAVGLKTPNVFVYAKTSTNDSQVYTYEPVKWIRRLRQASPNGLPKLLKVDFDTGHFTSPTRVARTSAIDCAILNTLVDKKY